MIQPAAYVDTFADVQACRLLVVGCGNLLRSDDGVGPVLIRHLWEGGVPEGVRLVDGGTAGMDVSFQMRGAERVILVDACTSGETPGTVYKVPGPAVEDLPPLGGLHTHLFRWDNALALGRWLLGDAYPNDVTVYLIEAADVSPGQELSVEVRAAMERVMQLIRREAAFAAGVEVQVEFTEGGYLHLNAALARQYFPGDAAVVLAKEDEICVIALRGTASGGLLLKQRNARGDRSLLVREELGDDVPVGARRAHWDPEQGTLRICRDIRPDSARDAAR
ncbi:MAG: hydrogenase maturation protease [Actinobacteria bacterium]|nr:hydrogenase maturation protease [Actinomycetota bacterium]